MFHISPYVFSIICGVLTYFFKTYQNNPILMPLIGSGNFRLDVSRVHRYFIPISDV